MQVSESITEPAQLQEVRRRRTDLRYAMAEVQEAASAALAGRPAEWGATLLPHVEELNEAWASHVSGTEGPGGLWDEIRSDAPRLDNELKRLGREHESLSAASQELTGELVAAGDDESKLARVREQANALVAQFTRHRQRGADLIYEAYEHDLGGHG
jgi:hypothetical protein